MAVGSAGDTGVTGDTPDGPLGGNQTAPPLRQARNPARRLHGLAWWAWARRRKAGGVKMNVGRNSMGVGGAHDDQAVRSPRCWVGHRHWTGRECLRHPFTPTHEGNVDLPPAISSEARDGKDAEASIQGAMVEGRQYAAIQTIPNRSQATSSRYGRHLWWL